MSVVLDPHNSAAAFPDRPGDGGHGLLVACASGPDGRENALDFGNEQSLLHVRVELGLGDAANGNAAVLRGTDEADYEVWRIALDFDTRAITVTLATGDTLAASPADLDWLCIELKVDTSGTATLYVHGVEAATATGSFGSLGTQRVYIGCSHKDSGLTGDYYLDELFVATAYVGPVRVTPSSDDLSDPARWLVLYDAQDADSAAWAQSYLDARGVPYANLCGLTSVPATETITQAEHDALVTQLSDYLTNNSLTVDGILIGHKLPGVVTISSVEYSWQSLLADLPGDPANASNTHALAGVTGSDDLPARSSLTSGGGASGAYAVGEITAATLADAQALTTSIDALQTTDAASRQFSALDPDTGRVGLSAATWADAAALDGTLALQRLRLQRDDTFDGSAHGLAVELTDATSGSLTTSDQTRAVLLTSGTSAAAALRSGSGLVKAAIDGGYAVAGGHVTGPADGELLNPAALLTALLAGWTLGEAVLLAAPVINSSWRVIGDPLGVVTFPRQGYHVYQRPTRNATDTLVAIVPANVATVDLDGYADGSEQFVQARAVSRCGVEDTAGLRLRRVAFGDVGDLILPTPNPPVGLKLERGADGEVNAVWAYRTDRQPAAPAQFNVYVATGVASIDYGSIDHTVTASGARRYTKSLGTFPDGTQVRCGVRSQAASGAEDPNRATAVTVADALAPDPAQELTVGVS